jgi:hypothetical protein
MHVSPACLIVLVAAQTHLLQGGYEEGEGGEGALLGFHSDVQLVFQNAMAFNEESTAIAQAATKLQVDKYICVEYIVIHTLHSICHHLLTVLSVSVSPRWLSGWSLC